MFNVLCGVGAHVDSVFRLHERARPDLSVPSTRSVMAGGCALNVACALASFGNTVFHAGIRGRDSDASTVANALSQHGVTDLGLVLPNAQTGHYAALLEPDGSLALATAAMEAYDLADQLVEDPEVQSVAASADAIVVDANAPVEAIASLARLRGTKTKLVLLATSTDKAQKLGGIGPEADLVFANASEWDVLWDWHAEIERAFVTQGEHGVAIYERGRRIDQLPTDPVPVVDVVGAGDAFCAGALNAWLNGARLEIAARRAVASAARCLSHAGALGWIEAERRGGA